MSVPWLLACCRASRARAAGRSGRTHVFLRAEQFHADALREIEFAVEARRRAVPEIVNLGGSSVAVEQVGRAALGKRGLRHPGDRRDSERRRQQESLHHGIPPAEPGAYPCGPSALPAPNSFRRRQPGILHFARWGPFSFPTSLRARGRPRRLPFGARLRPQALFTSLGGPLSFPTSLRARGRPRRL